MGLAGVDGEEGFVEGAGHVVCGEEVVEEPLFAEAGEVRGEDGDGEGAEVVGLVDGDEEVVHLERLNFEVAGVVLVSVGAGIDVLVRVVDSCSV